MTVRRSSFRLLALILTFGVAALPTPVFASGFQLVEQNASGLGNAFAGQAAGVKNASAIYFNPAALTRVKGWNLVASVEPIGVGATFTNSASTVPSAGGAPFPVPLGSEGGNAGKWIPVPNAYLSGQVGERVWVGASFNVPFGLETNWQEAPWMGRFHATKSKVEAYNVNPTVAFKVSDAFSIGVGANWQHVKADLGSDVAYGGVAYYGSLQALVGQGLPPATAVATLNALLVPQLGPAGVGTETSALISGTSNAWGWNAGALLEARRAGARGRQLPLEDHARRRGHGGVHGRADHYAAREPRPDRHHPERPVRERPRHHHDRPARHVSRWPRPGRTRRSRSWPTTRARAGIRSSRWTSSARARPRTSAASP